MDWALEHQAPQEKKSTVTALHLAAGFNKAESARFLLTECEALWRKASMTDSRDVVSVVANCCC
jgi:hypothetical protein